MINGTALRTAEDMPKPDTLWRRSGVQALRYLQRTAAATAEDVHQRTAVGRMLQLH